MRVPLMAFADSCIPQGINKTIRNNLQKINYLADN